MMAAPIARKYPSTKARVKRGFDPSVKDEEGKEREKGREHDGAHTTAEL